MHIDPPLAACFLEHPRLLAGLGVSVAILDQAGVGNDSGLRREEPDVDVGHGRDLRARRRWVGEVRAMEVDALHQMALRLGLEARQGGIAEALVCVPVFRRDGLQQGLRHSRDINSPASSPASSRTSSTVADDDFFGDSDNDDSDGEHFDSNSPSLTF